MGIRGLVVINHATTLTMLRKVMTKLVSILVITLLILLPLLLQQLSEQQLPILVHLRFYQHPSILQVNQKSPWMICWPHSKYAEKTSITIISIRKNYNYSSCASIFRPDSHPISKILLTTVGNS